MKGFNRTAFLVLCIVIFDVSLLSVYIGLQIASPSDGAWLQSGAFVWKPEGVQITTLFADGLETDDIVTAVDGRSIESWVTCYSCVRPDWHRGDKVIYRVLRDGELLDVSVRLGTYPLLDILKRSLGGLLNPILSWITIGFVFIRRPDRRDVQVLLLSFSCLLGSMPWAFGLQVVGIVRGTDYWLHRMATEGIYLLAWVGLVHFALIFPAPHPLINRHPRLIPALYPLALAVYIGYALVVQRGTDNQLVVLGKLPAAQITIVMSYLIAALLAVVTNYRFQHESVVRQQIRILVMVTVLILILAISLWLLPQLVVGKPVFSSQVMGVIGVLFPLALAVTILRYRLWDFEVIINRTLVYSSLTAIIVMIYVVLVGSLGFLFQTQRSLPISLVATGIVATLFQPLRGWLQHRLDHLMYGERDNPYRVLSRLGNRLEGTLVPDAVLPVIVETIAQALKLPYVAIALRRDRDYAVTAEYGLNRAAEKLLILPLIYQGETIGRLTLAPRSPNDSFTPPDLQLLDNIARQAAVAAHAVRLTTDLQLSRERLVTTREEERRRLRRDLHDGLGPVLASMSLKLDAIQNIVRQNPDTAHRLAGELKSSIQNALDDIRRIAYNLRPPALDELGLIGALREHVNTYTQSRGIHIVLDVPEALPPLAAAVEVAVYHITLEALTNVVRHADATECHIRIMANRHLRVEISDNGHGMPEGFRAGVGVNSMRERASEIGGSCRIESRPTGTQVIAVLPLFEKPPVQMMVTDAPLHIQTASVPVHESGET